MVYVIPAVITFSKSSNWRGWRKIDHIDSFESKQQWTFLTPSMPSKRVLSKLLFPRTWSISILVTQKSSKTSLLPRNTSCVVSRRLQAMKFPLKRVPRPCIGGVYTDKAKKFVYENRTGKGNSIRSSGIKKPNHKLQSVVNPKSSPRDNTVHGYWVNSSDQVSRVILSRHLRCTIVLMWIHQEYFPTANRYSLLILPFWAYTCYMLGSLHPLASAFGLTVLYFLLG